MVGLINDTVARGALVEPGVNGDDFAVEVSLATSSVVAVVVAADTTPRVLGTSAAPVTDTACVPGDDSTLSACNSANSPPPSAPEH
jgi:hypothetical protein